MKVSSLPHKAIDDVNVTLRKHGGDDIPFGGEIKECKLVGFFGDLALGA